MLESPPFSENTLNEDGMFSQGWVSWIEKLKLYGGSVSESGTTANRPSTRLFVGRPYFDTTLGKPVWVKTATGTPVWVDATGATV